jgi:hypothetical protein
MSPLVGLLASSKQNAGENDVFRSLGDLSADDVAPLIGRRCQVIPPPAPIVSRERLLDDTIELLAQTDGSPEYRAVVDQVLEDEVPA